jgi:DNA-directed RNA polymerase specialized sigma24 family protein
MPTIYDNLLKSQARVEEAIDDVKIMLRDHAAQQFGQGVAGEDGVQEWEVEWFEQVQKLLEMDAGWGLRGFWSMVAYSLRVSPTSTKRSTAVAHR